MIKFKELIKEDKDPVQEFEDWVFDPNREDADIPPIFKNDKEVSNKFEKEKNIKNLKIILLLSSVITISFVFCYINM